MTSTPSAISASGLTRTFAHVRAVDGLDLEVRRGEIFGFLGPNGAGKTTTIQLLLGLLEPSAGTARVLGFDPRTEGDRVRERCGALLEHTGLYEHLSAADNLEFAGRVFRMKPREIRERMKDLLGRMSCFERRKELAGNWSRGMKQRLALARALFHRPELVFLDEPTAGLDVIAAGAVRDELLSSSRRDGTTVFLTTHNMAEAEQLCSRVAVIRAGRLVAEGAPAELRRRGAARLEICGSGFGEELLAKLRAAGGVAGAMLAAGRLVVDLDGAAEAAPLVDLVVRSGGRVEEVRRGQASLEEAFRALMEEEPD